MRKKVCKTIMLLMAVLMVITQSAFAAESSTGLTVARELHSGAQEVVIEKSMTISEFTALKGEIVNILDGITIGTTPVVKMTVSNKGGNSVGRTSSSKEDLSSLSNNTEIQNEIVILNGMSSFEEKVKEINRFVCEKANYDYSFIAENGKLLPSQTAIGAMNGSAICQGYANLASYLYDSIGIQNVKVRGYEGTKNPVFHVWNVVKNGETLYVVDSTFNDGTGTNDYLLISVEAYNQKVNAVPSVNIDELFGLKYRFI